MRAIILDKLQWEAAANKRRRRLAESSGDSGFDCRRRQSKIHQAKKQKILSRIFQGAKLTFRKLFCSRIVVVL
jgi:hypothetical protein